MAICLALIIPAAAMADQATYSLSADTKTYKIKSIQGATATSTAVSIAKSAYPSGVPNGKAIVVSNETKSWPDAVAASSLAGALDCPILYVNETSLPGATATALTQLKVDRVYIVGGTSAVRAKVADDLKAKGFTVSRIWGQTFIDTQMKIYEFGKKNGIWDASTAFVATGKSYEDSLAAGPVAFKMKYPIFYVPTNGTFKSTQLSALKGSKISTFYIIGGTKAVTEDLEKQLQSVAKANAKKTGAKANVERIWGWNAYTTSKYVAQWAVKNKILSWNNTAFATGTSSLDSAPGSVLQGKTGAPILWVSNGNVSSIDALKGKNVSTLRVFGGKKAVSPYVRDEIALRLGFKLNDIQGFKVYIDAGHGQNNTGNGSYDSGAVGNGYQEAKLTKSLAGRVAAKLDAQGIDYFLNDDGGPYILRHAEAIAEGCNVIVSIHFNAGGGAYTLSLYNSEGSSWSPSIAKTMLGYLKTGIGLSAKGPWDQDVSILRGKLPATLLEVCFIDNASSMQKYETQEGYNKTGARKVSTQIALGITKL